MQIYNYNKYYKILKYFNILIWKIDYSPLRKLTSNKWSDNLLLLELRIMPAKENN